MEKFSKYAKNAILIANAEALNQKSETISTIHLLSGLLKIKNCIAYKILNIFNLNSCSEKYQIEDILVESFERAKREADLGIISTKHLLLGILLTNCAAKQFIVDFGLDLDLLEYKARNWIGEEEFSEELFFYDRSI